MTIHLVETVEEDSHIAVARHIGGLLDEGAGGKTALADTAGSKFVAECTALAGEGRWDELIKRMAGHLDLVFAKASEKDAECCASVIVLLVGRVEKDSHLAELARKLALDLSKQPEVMGEVKLNALLGLYSNVGTAPARYVVLLQALEFAKQSKSLAALLAPVVKGKADEWRRVWGLKPSMAIELHLQLASLMKVVGDRAAGKEYLRLLGAALALATDGADLAKVKPFAAEAVKAFVRSPDAFQCDFWELPAVTQLGRDAATAPLLQLLDTMLRGDLPGFKAAATPAVLEAVGVTAEAATDKTRMLALLVLGGRANGAAVPLAEVQAALDIPAEQVRAPRRTAPRRGRPPAPPAAPAAPAAPADPPARARRGRQVQPWLVRAIGAKLIDARIDQVASRVTVSRVHHRTFTSNEWAGLGQQLGALRDALAAAGETLAAKGSRGAPRAPQAVH
ncbi:eukaryotic translation initiation factor 3 subunit M [Scenedesmus sp. PABB004]|nr:eukaryotic translation initiation factor 3 subunit M [Scenedesmus sp. PABB004]